MSKHIVIADLDGTLADLTHRLHHVKGEKKNWHAFHAECVNDTPIADVIEIVLELITAPDVDRELYVLSGRNATVRKETTQWLEKHVTRHIAWGGYNDLDEDGGFYPPHLIMRKKRDFRPDTEVKLEMMRYLGFTPDDVLCIFDDRQSVVDMWRANGYRCLQVNAWKE